MFLGVSENKTFKERILDQRTKDKQEIEDWMHGAGGRVLAAMAILLGLWFIARLFWGA